MATVELGAGPVIGVATDISTTGLGLLCDDRGARMLSAQLTELSQECRIRVLMPEGYDCDEVSATARVAWVGTENSLGANAGLEFLRVPPLVRTYLQKISEEAYADAKAAIRLLTGI